MREQSNEVSKASALTEELHRLRQAERETVAIRARLESHQDEKDRLRQEIRDAKAREEEAVQSLNKRKEENRLDRAKMMELEKQLLSVRSELKTALADLQRYADDRDSLDQRLKAEADNLAQATEQRRQAADVAAEEMRRLKEEQSHAKLAAMTDMAALKQQLAMSEHERKAAVERLERCEKTCKDNSLV
jgi:chromosome segregation ATPase